MWIDPENPARPLTGVPQAHGCPRCASGPLVRVEECESVHWLCQSCGRCWEVRSGTLHATDPVACTGCASEGKAACFDVLRQGIPTFGQTDLTAPEG